MDAARSVRDAFLIEMSQCKTRPSALLWRKVIGGSGIRAAPTQTPGAYFSTTLARPGPEPWVW